MWIKANQWIIYRFFLYICGFLGIYIFTLSSQKNLNSWNTIQEVFVYVVYAWIIMSFSSIFARKLLNISISLLLSLPILSILILELLSVSIQGQSFNDVFFFHARFDVIETGISAYWKTVTIAMSFIFVFSFLNIVLYFLHTYSQPFRLMNVVLYGVLFISITTLLPNAPKRFFVAAKSYYSIDSSANFIDVSKKLESYGVRTSALSQTNVEVSAPPQPKNLVIIYLESLERSYTDEKVFPNLVPNIIELQKTALDFTNLDQLPGTHFTIAGQMASLCSVPLIFGNGADIYYLNSLAKINCLGDILKNLNYYEVFMHGAKLNFGATGTFFKSHGYNEVFGYEELVTPEILSEKYTKGWGLYDDTLFELAQKKYHELSKEKRPFMLTLATIDSHGPLGESSKSCPSYNSNSTMLSAIHCTDYLLGKFLQNIKENPAYKNTLVVILSDHLARKTDAEEFYPKNIADRKLLAFILNSGQERKIDVLGAHFDIPHTILDLMGIKTNSNLFLGQSLLQPIQSERYAIFSHKEVASLIKQFFYLADEREQHNFCDNEGVRIADLKKATITLGNRTVIMSYKSGGPTLPISEFFIAKLNSNGNIKTVGRYSYLKMLEMIRYDPNAIYFMVTKQCKIPFGLIPEAASNCDKWLWYMGTPTNMSGITGMLTDLNELKISPQTCQNALNNAKQPIQGLFALRDYIEKSNVIDAKEDFSFQLPMIKHKDQLFAVDFEKLENEKNNDMTFRVKKIDSLK